MASTESGERRINLKAIVVERLHDPLQLRILVTIVILLVGYIGVYMPLNAHITETTQRLNRDRKLGELADTVERLQTQCSRFEKRVPQQTDTKEWLQYMHSGVRQFPVKLSRLDCLDPKQIGPYKAIVLEVEVQGSFFELDRFLRWVESNPRLMRVDDISLALAKSKQKAKENKNDMVLRLTVLGMAG